MRSLCPFFSVFFITTKTRKRNDCKPHWCICLFVFRVSLFFSILLACFCQKPVAAGWVALVCHHERKKAICIKCLKRRNKGEEQLSKYISPPFFIIIFFFLCFYLNASCPLFLFPFQSFFQRAAFISVEHDTRNKWLEKYEWRPGVKKKRETICKEQIR